MIRFGQMTQDEVFISAEAAPAGVTFENHSLTDPLVTLRYFGPDVHSDMPEVGDRRAKQRHPEKQHATQHFEEKNEKIRNRFQQIRSSHLKSSKRGSISHGATGDSVESRLLSRRRALRRRTCPTSNCTAITMGPISAMTSRRR